MESIHFEISMHGNSYHFHITHENRERAHTSFITLKQKYIYFVAMIVKNFSFRKILITVLNDI